MAGTLSLTEVVGMQEVIVKPDTTVPEPTGEELDNVPGAKEAMRGLQALNLQACALQGVKVQIKQSWMDEFSASPHEVGLPACLPFGIMSDLSCQRPRATSQTQVLQTFKLPCQKTAFLDTSR